MKKTHRPQTAVACAVLVATSMFSVSGQAQSLEAARQAARKALQSNPEVTARLNAYLGKVDAQNVAKAGYLPRLDFKADGGINSSQQRGLPTQKINTAGAGLNLSQVLWDGLSTRDQVKRAGHERMSRWFELVDASEQTALEATRAVYDVQRLRKLVALAEDNLLQHQQAATKLESRVKAGVGRGVDLDQARARVALAESNRDTELANLHDVAARYQRIIGESPAADMGSVELLRGPSAGTADELVRLAISRSPVIASNIESVRAARAAAAALRSAYHPVISANAGVMGGRNLSGIDGRKADASVGLNMNWNLFNGGADRARVSEQQRAVAQAEDLRDKACRDVRQNALIAFNDVNKLTNQLNTLGRNSAAIERARDAYRQQFDIGQRSLLDLLNAENEAYTARRALTNAVYDRAVAYARTLASTSQLTSQLGISRELIPADGDNWSAGADGAGRCPTQAVEITALRSAPESTSPAMSVVAPTFSADATATSSPLAAAGSSTNTALAWPAANPSPVISEPLKPGGAPSAATDRSRTISTATLTNRVQAWANAKRKRNAQAVSSFYAPGYKGTSANAAEWLKTETRALAGKGDLDLEIEDIAIKELANGQAETRFLQSLTTNNGIEVNNVALTWARVAGQWRIVRERRI